MEKPVRYGVIGIGGMGANHAKKLQENKIECGTYHTPIHTIQRYKNGKLPITEKISHELVCLPNHPNLDHKDVKKIINVVNQFS